MFFGLEGNMYFGPENYKEMTGVVAQSAERLLPTPQMCGLDAINDLN